MQKAFGLETRNLCMVEICKHLDMYIQGCSRYTGCRDLARSYRYRLALWPCPTVTANRAPRAEWRLPVSASPPPRLVFGFERPRRRLVHDFARPHGVALAISELLASDIAEFRVQSSEFRVYSSLPTANRLS